MKETKLKPGDVVRVRGPLMTVERVTDKAEAAYARCIWFDAREQMQTAYIHTSALELAPPPDPAP